MNFPSSSGRGRGVLSNAERGGKGVSRRRSPFDVGREQSYERGKGVAYNDLFQSTFLLSSSRSCWRRRRGGAHAWSSRFLSSS